MLAELIQNYVYTQKGISNKKNIHSNEKKGLKKKKKTQISTLSFGSGNYWIRSP